MRRPDRLEALPSFHERNYKIVHSRKALNVDIDSLSGGLEPFAIGGIGVSRVVGALRIGATGPLRAPFRTDAGPRLSCRARRALVVWAGIDAVAGLAVLAGREPGRAFRACSAARLAMALTSRVTVEAATLILLAIFLAESALRMPASMTSLFSLLRSFPFSSGTTASFLPGKAV